jgi:DNA-directed RNA polymerase subunit RPC12/RpoP
MTGLPGPAIPAAQRTRSAAAWFRWWFSMEMMVVKCTSCKASLKLSKDKAGQTIRCPKCDAELALPKSEDTKPKLATNDDDDDDGGAYNVAFVDDEAARKQREEAQKGKSTKKATMRIKVRRKNIGDLDSWAKVHAGVLFLMIGACCWGVAYTLQMLVVFLGMVQGPEFGPNAQKFLIRPVQPPVEVGAPAAMDKPMFFLSLVSGSDFAGTAKILMIIAQVLTFMQAVTWMVGYGMCLPIENRMGTKGQLIGLFSLSGVNVLLNLFFRFLPLIGVLGYVLVPFYAPELVMSDVNTERTQPIHIVWCRLPTLEITISMVVYTALLMEPILIAVFIWIMAQMLRDEPLEGRAMGVIKMGFGILFLILTYQMYACAGTSSVLIKLERVIYTLWFAFQVGMIVKLATLCGATRDLLNFYLNPEE